MSSERARARPNQDPQLVVKISTPTNENFIKLQEILDEVCAPYGYRVTLFGDYLMPNPANTSWIKIAYNKDREPTPIKELKMAILVEIDCSEPETPGYGGKVVKECIGKLEVVLNPDANLDIVPVFAVHYGTSLSELRQLQDKVKELETQLQEMRATLETLKPPQ